MNLFRLRLFILIHFAFALASEAYAVRCEDIMEMTPHTASTWRELGDRAKGNFDLFAQAMQLNLQFGVEHRITDYEKHGRPHYMDELGFDFQNGTGPTLPEYFRLFDILQEKLLEKWNKENPKDQISEDDVIYPGFAFYNPKTKQWMVASYGHQIPEGFVHESEVLIPGKVLYPSLQAGLFPIMLAPPPLIAGRDDDPNSNLFIHDALSHQLSYLTHPDYARAYRWMASEIVDQGGWKVLKKKWNLYSRVFYFNENYINVDASVIDENWQLFKVPNKKDRREAIIYKRKDIEAELAKLSNEELWQTFRELRALYPKLVHSQGGVANDFDEAGYPSNYVSDFYNNVNLLFVPPLSDLLPEEVPSLRRLIIEKMGRFQTFVLGLAQISAMEWARWSLEEVASKDNKVYELMVESGVLDGFEVIGLFHSLYLPDIYEGFLDWPQAGNE